MGYALAALLPTCILGYLLWRSDQRFDEAEKAWRLERVGLLNRIQSPELAATFDAPEATGDPISLTMGDDKAYEKYMEDVRDGVVT